MFGRNDNEKGWTQAKDFSFIGYGCAGRYVMPSITRATNLTAQFDVFDIFRHRIVMFFFEPAFEKTLR